MTNIKIIIIIIIIIILLIHIPRICIDTKTLITSNNYDVIHGEDMYHKHIDINNNKSRIISWTYFEMSNYDWEIYIQKFKKQSINLIRNELSVINNIQDNKIIIENTDDNILNYDVQHNYAINICINNRLKIIKTVYNHQFCGGYFFTRYSAILGDGIPPILPTVPIITPFVVELSMLRMVYNKYYNSVYKKYTLVKSSKNINRLFYTLEKKNKQVGCSTKVWILWTLITAVMKTDAQRKGLDIMIPIAFNKLKNINNNIGVIFIKYKRGESIQTLEDNINNQKHQAISTNYYLRSSFTNGYKEGKQIRNNVDIVYTSSYIKKNKIKIVRHLTTFTDIADYGIYCFSATTGDTANVTITLNTQSLDINTLLLNIPNSQLL